MTDREKLEKVVNGLEICSAGEWNSTGGRDHTNCPYYPAGYTGCTCKLLMRDALALLRHEVSAQGPRVLTLDEYRAIAERPLEERVPVWIEWRGMRGRWAIPERAYQRYGVNWRCWTSRPTDEQREAVKWG